MASTTVVISDKRSGDNPFSFPESSLITMSFEALTLSAKIASAPQSRAFIISINTGKLGIRDPFSNCLIYVVDRFVFSARCSPVRRYSFRASWSLRPNFFRSIQSPYIMNLWKVRYIFPFLIICYLNLIQTLRIIIIAYKR